jgi:hypothetical protein
VRNNLTGLKPLGDDTYHPENDKTVENGYPKEAGALTSSIVESEVKTIANENSIILKTEDQSSTATFVEKREEPMQ